MIYFGDLSTTSKTIFNQKISVEEAPPNSTIAKLSATKKNAKVKTKNAIKPITTPLFVVVPLNTNAKKIGIFT